MKFLFRLLLLAALPSSVSLAQTIRKPAARPTSKPAPKSTAKPATSPVPRAAPRPASAPSTTAPPASPAPQQEAVVATGGLFDVGTSVLNLGIGLGSRYSYGGVAGSSLSVSPAFSLSYERGLLVIGPGVLAAGGFVGYQSASRKYLGFKDKFTDVIVAVRGVYHYPFSQQFDVYGGVILGVRRLGYSTDFNGSVVPDYGETGAASGLFVGGRYYFTESIGAFAELGFDQSYLKAGISAKF